VAGHIIVLVARQSIVESRGLPLVTDSVAFLAFLRGGILFLDRPCWGVECAACGAEHCAMRSALLTRRVPVSVWIRASVSWALLRPRHTSIENNNDVL